MVQTLRAGCRAEPRLITATPAARSTDPESSHLAAEEVTRKGQRARQQHAVLAAVHQHPGLTSRELARRTGIDRYTIARRLPELATAGRVRKGAQRECLVGRRQAVTWWAVEKKEAARAQEREAEPERND